MSLKSNSDYEVISNAEITSVIGQYSFDMISMVLSEILLNKYKPQITPMGNMVNSYELNFRVDSQQYSQFQPELLERRTELYSSIIDAVCKFHNLSYQDTGMSDIYTSASVIYEFLVSNYYQNIVLFFVNYLNRERKNLSAVLEREGYTLNQNYQFVKKRYENKMDLVLIHTYLPQVLNYMRGFDIDLDDIIDLMYNGTYQKVRYASFLKASLTDEGDFFKNYILANTFGPSMNNIITDIRMGLLPIDSNISDYVAED